MSFPVHRPRRLRRTEAIRRLVREVRLAADDFVLPLFVCAEENTRRPLAAIPGVDLLSGEPLLEEAHRIRDLGIPAVLLFAVVDERAKDDEASAAWSPEAPVQRAIRLLKAHVPQLVLIADLCLCEYTRQAHCGLLRQGEIDNAATLAALQKAAVSLAEAGADVVAPSGMMDGSVGALRSALDQAGFARVLTMPYSAKFASRLYGPFKQATQSAPAESLHATHQVDVASGRQALAKIALDVEEGADIVIVKPALGSLDILWQARRRFDVPLAAYHVSGEYNMVLAAARDDPPAAHALMMELLTVIKRAGADMIITYYAKEAAAALR